MHARYARGGVADTGQVALGELSEEFEEVLHLLVVLLVAMLSGMRGFTQVSLVNPSSLGM